MGVGEKDKITPDMIEWVVSDEKVASRYKNQKFKYNIYIYMEIHGMCVFLNILGGRTLPRGSD